MEARAGGSVGRIEVEAQAEQMTWMWGGGEDPRPWTQVKQGLQAQTCELKG